jgi:hypothetical protein
MAKMMQHAYEVAEGERFAFGANWWRFLKVLNDARIAQAEQSLRNMLGVSHLQGKSFLDIGSGSGFLRSLLLRPFSGFSGTGDSSCAK